LQALFEKIFCLLGLLIKIKKLERKNIHRNRLIGSRLPGVSPFRAGLEHFSVARNVKKLAPAPSGYSGRRWERATPTRN
jgi:hypothetical protein